MSLTPALVLAAAAPAANGIQDFLSGPLGSIVFFGGMLAFAYFMLIRPQQQRQKEHIKRITAIKRGDTVVMSSGMLGKVVRVEEDEIGVEIAQNVTVKMIKSMVHDIRTRGEPAAANDKS